jgi:hypothetical protein
MRAWWSAFCSIHSQRQGFQLIEGPGLVVGLRIAPGAIHQRREAFRLNAGLYLILRQRQGGGF